LDAFDLSNVEIKKVVTTAKIQLYALKKKQSSVRYAPRYGA
jgi:hypothetical protein